MSEIIHTSKRLFIVLDDKIIPVRYDQISFLKCEDEVVSIYLNNGNNYAVTGALIDYEAIPFGDDFIKIGRNLIINIDALKEISLSQDDDSVLIMSDGKEIPISKYLLLKFKANIRKKIRPQ